MPHEFSRSQASIGSSRVQLVILLLRVTLPWHCPAWRLLQERAPTEYDIRSGVTLEH